MSAGSATLQSFRVQCTRSLSLHCNTFYFSSFFHSSAQLCFWHLWNRKIQKALRRYLWGKPYAVESWRKDLWRPLQGLSAFQTLPHHIFFRLLQNFENIDLYFDGKHLLCAQWSKKLMSRLILFDVRAMLSHERSVNGFYRNPSTISNP